jgi:hypothetical protein
MSTHFLLLCPAIYGFAEAAFGVIAITSFLSGNSKGIEEVIVHGCLVSSFQKITTCCSISSMQAQHDPASRK